AGRAARAVTGAGGRLGRLEGREGSASISGRWCGGAQAGRAVPVAERLVAGAETTAALVIEVLGGNPEAFDARVHGARPHAGQAESAAHLRALLAGSRRLHDTAARGVPGDDGARPVQDAYTLRCVPQVLGAVRATIAHVRDVIEVEINAVTDNPTFFPEDDVVLHAGNFHGQPVALA